MSVIVYSQNDPRWKDHVLGFGPRLGTIGAYGCVDSVKAMISTCAGYLINPRQINDVFTTKKIFTRDETGTYDYLPDNALALAWPDRFKFVGSYTGRRDDLIAKALPTPDQYAEIHISSAAVPTHRVWVIGGKAPNWTIGDPWDGRVKPLSAYGINSVSKTILTKELPQPVPVKPPTPIVPPPIDPPPIVIAPPVDPVIIPPDPIVVKSDSQTFWDYLFEVIKAFFTGAARPK